MYNTQMSDFKDFIADMKFNDYKAYIASVFSFCQKNRDGSYKIPAKVAKNLKKLQQMYFGELPGNTKAKLYKLVDEQQPKVKQYLRNKPATGIIVAGFGGLGKTYISHRYNNCIDIDSIYFRYIIPTGTPYNIESFKSKENRQPNPEWPQNYINAITSARKMYDVVFTGMHDFLLQYFEDNNIPYYLAYPKDDYIDTLKLRYKKRGNNQAFINKFHTLLGEWRKTLNNYHPVKFLYVSENEHLIDVLIKEKILCEQNKK